MNGKAVEDGAFTLHSHGNLEKRESYSLKPHELIKKLINLIEKFNELFEKFNLGKIIFIPNSLSRIIYPNFRNFKYLRKLI
ncbi:hypothetical protein BpHYR1_024210 [Brachionus plicatilis]|uniref:Uncharacterized protein n=1 Tax=Brachionus plicatilis TaxID=10195 RepID=A0A3M7SH79_BRAPC|nr:hypothetical protein BpHYR1_024210 [Brachionus plicatilis]